MNSIDLYFLPCNVGSHFCLLTSLSILNCLKEDEDPCVLVFYGGLQFFREDIGRGDRQGHQSLFSTNDISSLMRNYFIKCKNVYYLPKKMLVSLAEDFKNQFLLLQKQTDT